MSAHPVPGWLRAFADSVPDLDGDRFSRFLPPPAGGRRHSAVLVLFGPDPAGGTPDGGARVVITERAHSMRSHAGQPAFPGGATEPEDRHATDTALREAWEEIDLDRGSVDVLAELPTLHIPVSGYDVTPVVGWWRSPDPASLWAKDPREVARVVQPTVAELVDPGRRFRVRHPSGFVGPAWDVNGLLVWGFTAGILDRVLDLAGVAEPWDTTRVRDLPA